ncbi:PepSY domain-containing protein [Paracoccus sp. (in: a-proteobacteria)]|uniref:PepSY domain-containing protein n=1 Tax=Paracoccus sp. TaxID=267 RepID=UPI0026E02938|nr:PepSY domain-containing protein [Paracoccus sp. (in: a-proteobacteria)]MDO5646606.1 PepSY domain-containing protein [Paracoccus sp. (in: a-proteobacteria)]
MFRTIGIAAVFAVMAGGAIAQSAESHIRQQLRAQGFSQIEIERDDGKIEVEARRGNQKIELKYDARTGRLISQDIQRSDRRDGNRATPARNARDSVVRSRVNDDDDDDGRVSNSRKSRDTISRSRVNDDDDDDGRAKRGKRLGRDDNDDDD